VPNGTPPNAPDVTSPNLVAGTPPNATGGAQPNATSGAQPNVPIGAVPKVMDAGGALPTVVGGTLPNATRGAQPHAGVGAQPNGPNGTPPNVQGAALPTLVVRTPPNASSAAQPDVPGAAQPNAPSAVLSTVILGTPPNLAVGTPPDGLVGSLVRLEPDPAATASVLERGEDSLTIHYRAAAPGLLRIAIAAYPGWHAAANGAELPVLTVDDALLGVVVPAGEADLQLWYAPRFFWPAAAISLVASLACLAALIADPDTGTRTPRGLLYLMSARTPRAPPGRRSGGKTGSKGMLFLLPLWTLWWPLGLPIGGLGLAMGLPFGGLSPLALLNVPASASSVLAYAVVFIGMGLFAKRALNA
jgi:hypothetical protein